MAMNVRAFADSNLLNRILQHPVLKSAGQAKRDTFKPARNQRPAKDVNRKVLCAVLLLVAPGLNGNRDFREDVSCRGVNDRSGNAREGYMLGDGFLRDEQAASHGGRERAGCALGQLGRSDERNQVHRKVDGVRHAADHLRHESRRTFYPAHVLNRIQLGLGNGVQVMPLLHGAGAVLTNRLVKHQPRIRVAIQLISPLRIEKLGVIEQIPDHSRNGPACRLACTNGKLKAKIIG